MKAEIFDALSNEEKIAHLSEMASQASAEKYANRKALRKDKEAGETMPGRHTELSAPTLSGLFEEEEEE